MIIHGLADDNVVVAHSLRLSSALLSAGYPHTRAPLSGVTHLASQEEVAGEPAPAPGGLPPAGPRAGGPAGWVNDE